MFEKREWVTLIGRLLSLTEERRLDWRLADKGVVVAQVSDFLYRIGSDDEDGREPFYLSISKKDPSRSSGESTVFAQIDRVDSIPGAQDDPWDTESIGRKIVELQGAALRSAQGAPQLFEELLNGLSALDDHQPPF